MKETIAEETAMVSVPCVTTTPCAPSPISLAMPFAIIAQCSGSMFSESMFETTVARRFALSSSGKSSSSSAAFSAGTTPPVR